MLTWIHYLDRVIRGDASQTTAVEDEQTAHPVGGLTLIGALLGALYGLCMASYAIFQGGNAPFLQAIATMLKVPALFFLTLAVTFPSLYVFNALVGSRLSASALLRLLVISLSVMLTVLASLGPIVAFFAASTTSYPFMTLLNVAIFSVSGFLGLRYLLISLKRLAIFQEQPAVFPPAPLVPPVPPTPPSGGQDYAPLAPPHIAPTPSVTSAGNASVRVVFAIWMVVFGLVGSQMAWVLRPFLGHPHAPFSWLRGREASFFEGFFHALRHLFS